jgi:serine/threonine-protein phosphatase 4 regulatory subunit 1
VLLEFIPQIPKVVQVFMQHRSSIVADQVIPLFIPLISSSVGDVSKAAIRSIIETAPLISAEDSGQKLFFVILTAVHDDSNEDLRVAAIELLGETAGSFGANLCESFIAPDIESLVDSESLKLRKASAKILPKVAQVMRSEAFTRRLAPVFIKFCNDGVWSVRKNAIEGLTEIYKHCTPDFRPELVEIFKKTLEDKSRWVKLTASQQLGPFIIEAGTPVDDKVLRAYLKLSASDAESELKSSCAFYFSGVLLTLGVEAWPTLQPTFNQMCVDQQIQVRKSIAASVHEVGRIIGPERSESDLKRAFDSFINDRDASVKQIALMNLSSFIETVSVSSRATYLHDLGLFVLEVSWRTRDAIARQLPKLATLFDLESTFSSLLPMAFKLSRDCFAAVRTSAAPALGLILARLHAENEEWGLQAAAQMQELALSRSSMDRQAFVLGCSLVTSDPVFQTVLADSFARLVNDPVSNVRLCAAQVVESVVSPGDYWTRLAHQLRLDSDEDVKYAAGGRYDTARGLQNELSSEHSKPTLAPLRRRPSTLPCDDEEEIKFEESGAVHMQFIGDFLELEEEYTVLVLS